ncbi:hypothetical protein [Craterilacuibacter sp. RT1T]|uniref:hypothetical protein n=1 Tax=Craterilacuibacter sp. RT1T TaxID=2942211 RepID=UPI0020C05CFF|nr:hypothetical protein [Craterilacuibacter sp. RT1T]MCL6261960.1 hypothetical protein [Craterilacuibacter sp. RT1T]
MWTLPHFLAAELLPGAKTGASQRLSALLAYPVLLWCVWQLRFLPFLLPAAALILVYALALWHINYRRYRAIADTPTARARSAALGYTELYGYALGHEQAALFSSLSGRPCVWYRWHKEWQGRSVLGKRSESAQSEASWRLRDKSGGEVIIHPEGATIHSAHRRVTREDGWRITEEWIAEHDPLYVLGHLSSLGGAPSAAEHHSDVKAALEQLKQDKATLLARFDRNRDGQIDMEEWEAARRAIHGEISREHAELAAAPLTHHLSAPGDGRHFIISHRAPAHAARHFRRLAWLHPAAAGLSLWLLNIIARH